MDGEEVLVSFFPTFRQQYVLTYYLHCAVPALNKSAHYLLTSLETLRLFHCLEDYNQVMDVVLRFLLAG